MTLIDALIYLLKKTFHLGCLVHNQARRSQRQYSNKHGFGFNLRCLPSLASISLTFLRLKVGFLRDSGYTHGPPTLRHRVQAGFVRSHLSFRDLHMTQAKGSMPAGEPETEGPVCKASDSMRCGGMRVAKMPRFGNLDSRTFFSRLYRKLASFKTLGRCAEVPA